MLQLFRLGLINRDVYRCHISRERQGIIQRFKSALMDCGYWQNHSMAPSRRRLAIIIQRKVLSQIDIMTMDGKEAHHNCWQEQYNDPCSIGKFGDGEDQSDDASGDCAQAIDCQLPSPASVIRMHHFLLGKLD